VLQDKNNNVRFEAAWSLGHLGATNTLARLATALRDKDSSVRFAAAFALVEINDPRAIPVLRTNLLQSDENARLAAATALTMLGDTNGLDTVRRALNSNVKWRRFAAALALARANTPTALKLLSSRAEDRIPAIRKLALGAREGKASLALADSLRDPDRDMRQYAARALIFFNDPATLPALLQAAKDPEPEVRAAARLAERRVSRR